MHWEKLGSGTLNYALLGDEKIIRSMGFSMVDSDLGSEYDLLFPVQANANEEHWS
jgi:hypothetical protein